MSSDEGVSVNGVSIVFCDRCEAGYEGVDGMPFGGAIVAIDRSADNDNDADIKFFSICLECLEELDAFVTDLRVV
jgi:hypothetical protein